jgi:hypothetical protein
MRRLLLIACAIFAIIATAYEGPGRPFPLPNHGSLILKIPDGWTASLRQPPKELPPTITLAPRNSTPFTILITAIWPLSPTAGLTDEATLRAETAAAAREAESQSVEGSLPLKEFSGVGGGGYYFSATDRAPKPGEFKYLTQGAIRKGEIALLFTVLTNDGQGGVIESALEMLRTAVHQDANGVAP